MRERAALLGHDIRNAVADIMGGLSLADLSALDSASRQQLDRVRSASEQLARLTDEALALLTGETSTDANNGHGQKLAPLLDTLHARWSAHAREKGLSFSIVKHDDLPATIGTDRNALDRILANVIGNAMKYGGNGTVTLTVKMSAQETLCFSVRDTGSGFSDGALARLFELHGRAPDNVTPGSGMGLHIVRNLAKQINGRMEVGNHPDGGAEIVLSLPRAAWAPGVNAPAIAADLPDLSGHCVLLAEDNPTNQLLIRQMLETLGADCVVASDGQEALEQLHTQPFDLALIDIEMPRLSGLDLIRALRRIGPDASQLPVLAITAYVLSANRDGIYEAGADGILAKPILSLEAFGEAIIGVMQKRAGPLDEGPRPVDTRAAPVDALHLDRLLALAGAEGGRELLLRLRQDFETVRQGIVTGLETTDYAQIRGRTHVLISLAGAIGADSLQDMADRLNAAAHHKAENLVHNLGPLIIESVNTVTLRLADEFASRFGEGGK